jgi:signal recognition particle GTPase
MTGFKKADKKQAKLRCSVFGPSGAGKTMTSLRIANGFLKAGLDSRIAFIDSERGSASKYADKFDFDVLELDKKTILDYTNAIKIAAENKYQILIIDSLSHAWQELIEEVDKIAKIKYKGNTWGAWSEGTPKQRLLIDSIINYPGHIIATIRSKTEWEIGDDKKPRRIGLSPEQGKGIEYEFDMLMEMSVEHYGTIIKDRTGKYQDAIIKNPDETFGTELINWLNSGSAISLPIAEVKKQEIQSQKQPIKSGIEETFSKFKTAISECLITLNLDRFIKASQTFDKYVETLPEEIFEEYSHYMTKTLTQITEQIESGDFVTSETQRDQLIKLFPVWKNEISRVYNNQPKKDQEERIF